MAMVGNIHPLAQGFLVHTLTLPLFGPTTFTKERANRDQATALTCDGNKHSKVCDLVVAGLTREILVTFQYGPMGEKSQ